MINILSILTGFLIGVGGIINLYIGGIEGAFFFSLGLITIVTFKGELFTGKAGLLTTNEITIQKLGEIWLGNLFGTMFCASYIGLMPIGQILIERAQVIVELRTSQSIFVNAVLGMFCGLLMYIAITGFQKTNNFIIVIMPVMFFILCGFNHCVADMFYTFLGANSWKGFLHLIPTTVGNIIGANIIPYIIKNEKN